MINKKGMKNKEVKKALTSDKPINAMYNLIPASKLSAFKKFAKQFGYTEERINNLLQSEK